MADQLLEQIRELVEGQIDFEGQKFSELLSTAILAIVGGVAFIVGFILQDIKLALYIGLGGTFFTFALVVPPWPMYNKHPVQWLPVTGNELAAQGITVDGKMVG